MSSREVITSNGLGWGTEQWVRWLQNSQRYEGIDMVHRPDMFTHVMRTAALASYLTRVLDYYEGSGDPVRRLIVEVMGRHHDDPEMLGTDILAPIKDSWTEEQRAVQNQTEETDSRRIGRFIFGLENEDLEAYIQMQQEIREKRTPYSQIVDIADKWDALGEKVHEVRCGNPLAGLMLAQSENKFENFEEYSAWPTIRDCPNLSFGQDFPDIMIAALPRLKPEDLTSSEATWQSFLDTQKPAWPRSYQVWCKISYATFSLRTPEKFIFPGWALQLWQKGVFPYPRTSAKGVSFPIQ